MSQDEPMKGGELYLLVMGGAHVHLTYKFSELSLLQGVITGVFCVSIWVVFWLIMRYDRRVQQHRRNQARAYSADLWAEGKPIVERFLAAFDKR